MSLWTRLLTIAAAGIVSYGVHSKINDWTAIGPNGGWVQQIAYSKGSPTTVYLTSVAGFHRSTDGGASWQPVKVFFQNIPSDMAADPSDPQRVYVLSVNAPYLFVSTDSGQTLKPVTSFPINLTNPWQIQVSQNGQILFVTAGSRIIVSTDRGQSWAERTVVDADPNTRVIKLLMDPTDSNTLYASVVSDTGPNGIFVTHDGARTWTRSTWSTNSLSYTTDIAISALDPATVWTARFDGVWVTHDRGVTWSKTTFNVPAVGAAAPAASAIAIDSQNPAMVYGANPYGAVLRSTDGGASWTDVTGNSVVRQPSTLAAHPTRSGTILMGGMNGVWGTVTAGMNWSSQVQGFMQANVTRFTANAFTDRIYFNSTDSNIGYVAGGAVSASSINQSALQQLSPSLGSFMVNSMLAQPGPGGHLFVSLTNGIASSADGGDSWTLQPVLFPGGTQMVSLDTWPGSPQTILAVGYYAQFRSTDGGNLWSAVTDGLPAQAVLGKVVTSASDPTIAYSAPYGVDTTGRQFWYGLYRSTDGGRSWTSAGQDPSQVYALAIDPADARTVYESSEVTFRKSTDGALTWTAVNWDKTGGQGFPVVLAIDPIHPKILYAATGTRISRSVDGGSSWQALPASPNGYWMPNDLIADPNRTSDILVATYKSSAFRMTIAPDLALSVQAPGANGLAAGSSLTYAYTAVNNGPFDATGVQLVIHFSTGFKNASGSLSGGNCTTVDTVVTCTRSILRTSESVTASITANAPESGAFQVKGSLTGDQPDSDSTNNDTVTDGKIGDTCDLTITVSGPSSVQVGNAVSYTLTVSNAGPATATSTQLNYQLAAGMTLGAVTTTAGTCTTATSGLVSCSLGDLSVSKSVTVTVNAMAAAAGAVSATTSVKSDQSNPNASNSSATSNITVSTASSQGGTGGGGGGAFSAAWLLALSALLLIQKTWEHRLYLATSGLKTGDSAHGPWRPCQFTPRGRNALLAWRRAARSGVNS